MVIPVNGDSSAEVLIIRGQGPSLVMFGGTIWMLLSQRSTRSTNRKMFTVACALLLVSTAVRVSGISVGQILIYWGHIAPRDRYH